MLSPITGSSPEGKRHGDSLAGTFDSSDDVSELPRKRRKTNIMESFKSFSLKQPDEIPRKAQHPEREEQYLDTERSSFHEDDEINSQESDDQDATMLSDREEAERKIMYELVYGPEKSGRPRHPVDAKVEEWIQQEIRRRKKMAITSDQQQHTTQDDMKLDHMSIYQDASRTYRALDSATSRSLGQIQRSNSLPNVSSIMDVDGDAVMDTS